MKYLLLFSVILFSMASSAQDCSEELLLQKPGIWKEGMKGSQGGTAADLIRQKKIVAAIHTMIKLKYTPKGVIANFGGVYGRSEINMPGNFYGYRIKPLNYYCDGNNIKTADESPNSFSIFANMFDAEIYDTAQRAEGFTVMSDMPEQKNGYWYFKDIDENIGFGMTGKSSMWLITYDGKLPYAYVSKKEFLEKRKRTLYKEMQEMTAGFKDVLKNLEMDKGFKETEYKNNPEKLKKYMKMDYLQIKERYEKLLADNEITYKPAFDKIDAQLKMPAAELSQQAIVKIDPYDHLSYLFTDDNDSFGKILVKPNPGYFNNKLPKSSPQFFWINLVYNHKEPIATQFREDIIKSVDFATLKNMLGK